MTVSNPQVWSSLRFLAWAMITNNLLLCLYGLCVSYTHSQIFFWVKLRLREVAQGRLLWWVFNRIGVYRTWIGCLSWFLGLDYWAISPLKRKHFRFCFLLNHSFTHGLPIYCRIPECLQLWCWTFQEIQFFTCFWTPFRLVFVATCCTFLDVSESVELFIFQPTFDWLYLFLRNSVHYWSWGFLGDFLFTCWAILWFSPRIYWKWLGALV